MLRESLGDFERVKGVLGRDTVETIVQAERQREQALKGQKRVQQRKKFRKDDGEQMFWELLTLFQRKYKIGIAKKEKGLLYGLFNSETSQRKMECFAKANFKIM